MTNAQLTYYYKGYEIYMTTDGWKILDDKLNNLIFATEEDARSYITINGEYVSEFAESIEDLTHEYTIWLNANDLPHWSADDLVNEPTTTAEQKAWLYEFIDRWYAAEDDAS